MKIIGKVIILLFLIVVMLTSCNGFTSTPTMNPTDVVERSITLASTEAVETQAADATPGPSIIEFLATPLPPTEPSIPTSSIPFSGIPTIIPMANELTWSECVVPNRDYARSQADMEFLASCIDTPTWSAIDENRMGERIEVDPALGDWRITIGNDLFETKLDDLSNGCCSYQLSKNGKAILEMSPGFMTSDPNRKFWNIGGKLVWELAGYTTVIVVDGVDFNEKYHLEGSFFPYEIKGKLIYIAKQDGKYHIVYDDKVMGTEFDQISMAYCCGMVSVYYGGGQYWFVGKRGGIKFVVSIE